MSHLREESAFPVAVITREKHMPGSPPQVQTVHLDSHPLQESILKL